MNKTKQYFREISKKVESGAFYEDAKEWYYQKYLYPVIERSFFLFITAISVCTSAIAIYTIIDFLPLVRNLPIAVKSTDTANFYTHITPMGDVTEKNKDADNILQKHLLARVVSAYERYDYINDFRMLEVNMSYMEHFATKEVQNNYKNYVSVTNPNGLMLRYRDFTKRDIQVLDKTFEIIKLPKLEDNEIRTGQSASADDYIAYVDFIGYEKTDDKNKGYKWKAKIDFRYSNVTYNSKTKKFSPLDFVVTDYQSVEIPSK